MNTENFLDTQQITAIFRQHGMARSPSITRLTTGFTNEVYAVDDYILKVCVNTANEPNFEREVFLYQALRGQVLSPRPLVAETSKTRMDRFYMIYPKVEEEPAGQRWHLLDDRQRKQFIEDLHRQLRCIDHFPRPAVLGTVLRSFGSRRSRA